MVVLASTVLQGLAVPLDGVRMASTVRRDPQVPRACLKPAREAKQVPLEREVMQGSLTRGRKGIWELPVFQSLERLDSPECRELKESKVFRVVLVQLGHRVVSVL